MTATDHVEFRDNLPAYALGILSAAEAAALESHLARCPACRRELDSFRGITDAMLLAVPAVAPSPALRGRLLAEVARYPTASATAPRRRAGARPFAPRHAWPVLAVLALAAIIMGGLLWATAGRWLSPPAETRSFTLTPTGAAPDASGELRFDGRAATLEVVGLPQLPADRQYQLWLSHDGARDSGAVFSVNDNGWAEVPVDATRPLGDYSGFGITIEPAGGSPGPTGERVLGYSADG